MKTNLRHLTILTSTMLVLGCAGLDGQAWNKRTRQDPKALTVPKKWMLQSYVFNGEEKITKGGGAWIAFGPNNGFTSYNGVNWSGHGGGEPVYDATADGGFRLIAENQISTLVGLVDPSPDFLEDMSRRSKLISGATTFECTGNTLILSDGTEHNQLRYLARMR